jgi:hypothetical protein
MKYFTTILILAISIRVNAQTAIEKLPKDRLTFDRHQIDPNEMLQNKDFPEIYNYTFHYKNTGNESVFFTRCQCPCGCYVINDFTKEKIKPGDEGEFTVSYYYREGMNNKSVFLHTTIADPSDAGGYKRYEFKVVGEFK